MNSSARNAAKRVWEDGENRRIEDRRIEDRRIEASVTRTERGDREIVLQDLSYGSGVGWYVQKTIRLDARQVEALMGALCVCRQEAGGAPGPIEQVRSDDGKILHMPRVGGCPV